MNPVQAPEILRARFDFHWQSFVETCPAETFQQIQQSLDASTKALLARCWMGSDFAAELCCKRPDYLLDLLQTDSHSELTADDYQQQLSAVLNAVETEDQLLKALRDFRNRQMLRIIWRDLNRLASTLQTTAELSHLADACIQQATDFCHQQLCARHGTPQSPAGEAQELLVIGMGKLGAHELNLSSDIDLIFAYPEEGQTDHRIESISNHQFFIKLGQKLINALGKITADGFVFRVDMALRPHGGSGPLACSFATMENYYQEQGRSWERYAMIKARVITGQPQNVDGLMDILRPFTYRRYIDYSVVQALREMKALINREVKRKNVQDNVKLGPGGIREIEFIVQATQLIRGGREIEFQQREIVKMFEVLHNKQLFSAEQKQQVLAAYLFLRDTEHVLQAHRDEQTQQLPSPPSPAAADELAHQRMAYLMGFSCWHDFAQTLQQHRDTVSALFKEFASFDDKDDQSESSFHRRQSAEWLLSLWESKTLDEKKSLLHKHLPQFTQTDDVAECLQNFQQEKSVGQIHGDGKSRLDIFLPKLLNEVLLNETPPQPLQAAQILQRVFPLVLAVLRRSAYLVLLNENPQAIRQLVTLAAASPWIADQLSQHPVLLDELLDERSLFYTPDKNEIADALRQEVLRIPLADLEGQMEALRYFKLSRRLHIAACEVTGRLPLMKVSDYLTWLAEAILQHALNVAWHDLVQRYGTPLKTDGSECNPSFIVVGYGKLGGLELSHNSDLDVVFIHGADPLGSTRHPERSMDNATFFARLGQRLIHIMETRSHSGQLYEMDTQLRPSGNSGMLVISMEAFAKYQKEQAWTWEHQALVRARVVAGCPELADQFNQLRNDVLSQQRDMHKLKQDVLDMRERMFKHLANKNTDAFDLKQDRGGIIDIEFLVQYAVLAWAQQHHNLLRWPDNIRLLEELATARLLSAEQAQQLIDAYKALRCLGHQKALQNEKTTVADNELVAERQQVRAIWQQFFG